MAFSYDPTTPAGWVRLLIPDTIGATALYDDTEIAAFLAMTGGDVHLAAATALETAASNQAMTLKVLTVLGVTTNGAAVSTALLDRAARLRACAGANVAGAVGGEYVGVASAVVDEFTWREMTA